MQELDHHHIAAYTDGEGYTDTKHLLSDNDLHLPDTLGCRKLGAAV